MLPALSVLSAMIFIIKLRARPTAAILPLRRGAARRLNMLAKGRRRGRPRTRVTRTRARDTGGECGQVNARARMMHMAVVIGWPRADRLVTLVT